MRPRSGAVGAASEVFSAGIGRVHRQVIGLDFPCRHRAKSLFYGFIKFPASDRLTPCLRERLQRDEAALVDPGNEPERPVYTIWNKSSHWILLLCLLSAGLYCVLRINRLESHRFFGAHLDPALTVTGSRYPTAFEKTGYLKPGEKIVAVDGTRVRDLRQFRDALEGSHHKPIVFELLATDGGTRRALFWDAPQVPSFHMTAAGGVGAGQALPAELTGILEGLSLTRIEGKPAERGLLTVQHEKHPEWVQFDGVEAATGQAWSALFWSSDYRSPWTLLLVGICFGGLGLTVHYMRAGTRSSRAFLWFSFALALFFYFRAVPGLYREPWEMNAFGLLLCAIFPISANFVGTFTSVRNVYARSDLYFHISMAVALGLLLVWMTQPVRIFMIFWSASHLVMLATVIASSRLLLVSGVRIPEADLQRNRIATVALALSFGPSLLYLFLEVGSAAGILTFVDQAHLPPRFWFDLPAICFPLLIGYAVIRRNLLQVNELLIEGATYGVLALGMGGVFATFVGLAVPAVERIRPGSSVLMTAMGAGLVAWFGYPIFNRSRRQLAERFHQSLRGYDVLVDRLSTIGEDAEDRVGFCRDLVPSLRDLTRAATVTIVLPPQFAAAPISCGECPEPAEEQDRYWRRIMNTQIESPRELQREELIDSGSKEEEAWELLDALDALRLLFVFPLISEGMVQGLVGVSGKVDHRNYSRAEVQKLRVVARECALALYGFTVRENMRAKRRAEENLRRSEEKLRDSQKLEAVATLAGGIAHDFHNLITAIFAFTSVAKDTLPFDHPAAGAIDNVEEAARQASGITKSLLVFTRKTHSERNPLDLGQFVPRAVRFVHGVLPKNIALECEVDQRFPLWIEADESQLHQVIMNLVVNARDAMSEGGEIQIRVSRNRVGGNGSIDPNDRIVIEIQDSGPGMTEEVRRRAFEPFFTTKNRDQGTGLGLSIVRGIVQDNGGSIDLDSAPGAGTRLELTFPACAASPSLKNGSVGSKAAPSTDLRVLVADDNDMIRTGLSTCLVQEGFEVVQARNGEVFQEIIEQSWDCIDLVVLDLDMPGMDGIDCLNLLEREGIRLPVILITGEPVSRFDRVSYPNATLLKKPFGIPGFMRAVNERLARGSVEDHRVERLTVS